MATRAAAPRVDDGENSLLDAKGAKPAATTRSRRALGDIGNTGVTTRAQAGKVAPATKPAAAAKPRAAGATAAAALRSTAAAAPKRKSGASLSSVLQTRSEAAAAAGARRAAAATPASPLPDIDSVDRADPLAEAHYAQDIYCYYRRVEPRFVAPPDYMKRQTEVNPKMRGILMDWLVEVHLKFKLMPETLYLTANVIDRYLAAAPVSRRRVQLVGVTGMLIASKYEEIWAPEVRDFVYISDKAYSREDILDCEKTMLQALSYDLTVPTPYLFLARFKKAAGPAATSDARVGRYAEFLLEASLLDYGMLSHPPSLLAAAALHAALLATGAADAWPRALRKHSRFDLARAEPVARALVDCAERLRGSSLKAVLKKYSSPKFAEVACLPPPFAEEEGEDTEDGASA